MTKYRIVGKENTQFGVNFTRTENHVFWKEPHPPTPNDIVAKRITALMHYPKEQVWRRGPWIEEPADVTMNTLVVQQSLGILPVWRTVEVIPNVLPEEPALQDYPES